MTLMTKCASPENKQSSDRVLRSTHLLINSYHCYPITARNFLSNETFNANYITAWSVHLRGSIAQQGVTKTRCK